MTRVLSVLTSYPPSLGGAQQHAHALHQRLRASGHEAFVDEAARRGVQFVITPNHHPHWSRSWHWWWWDLYQRAARVLVLSDAEARQLSAGGVDAERIIRTVVGPVGEAPEADTPVAPPAAPPVVAFLGQPRSREPTHELEAALDEFHREMARVERVPELHGGAISPGLDDPGLGRSPACWLGNGARLWVMTLGRRSRFVVERSHPVGSAPMVRAHPMEWTRRRSALLYLVAWQWG